MSTQPSPSAEEPRRRQRIATYALLTRDGQVLLTRMSARTRIAGRWTLPGGGIDHGEDPRDAVRREVYEETGLKVEPAEVLDVHASHFVGLNHDGVLEDYHGVHVIYRAEVLPESEGVDPVVLEVGGSTDAVAWVPREEALTLDLLSAARHALEVLDR